MSRGRLVAILGAVVSVVLVAGFLLLHGRSGADEADQEAKPTALVTVASVQSQTLQDAATVYGVVQADPSATSTVSAPRAVIVSQVMVRAGQTVAAGQPLVEIASAPASTMAYQQAADAASAARSDLARVQRLFDARLAASDQLIAARKALGDALAALAAEQRQGAALVRQTLRAPASAVVTSIATGPGDHAAQDAALVTLARTGAVSAKLGLEPGQGPVTVGAPVIIRPVNGGAAIASHLTMVGRAADPASKTVDAVAPLSGVALPIGAAVRADIVTGSHTGLAAPRAAVVFDETGDHVFVVEGGKARRVFVSVGRDYGDLVEVKGGLSAGQQVAVEGAYELTDGMAVKVAGK
ncbi:MAG TPA: efflux RND transporter periplasmic adaptor subunit [Caulobacteraceae bacterium]|nr:efflux RND transporter periplasmic adaptor subunit [Caulobacteraceae bacterium]